MSTPAGDSPGMGLDPQTQVAWGIVRITTGGIQDLAALIPLLTTEVCEKHVNKALKKGLLYAAAAPMTIFGSLGIAKAGFIALCASIDHPFFHGPALLKNAGFRPIGMGKMFLHVKHEKHHLYKAEDKLRRLLNKKKFSFALSASFPGSSSFTSSSPTFLCTKRGSFPSYAYAAQASSPSTSSFCFSSAS
ncbi:hypothetical protein FA13DRAFT_892179 [Coprinellus micaceus]|uniref:Uncharacterized protein n=1 Tax=Coprinellus micaceus TaxID=71717 RepID=A0A4Y7TSS0_COPMI|nr:hypothetical protein FA13DRAFT_892179 [Coprinellus micaceus]